MFPNTQTQPLFPLPNLQLYLSPIETSLAMVSWAASMLESSPNSAPQLPNHLRLRLVSNLPALLLVLYPTIHSMTSWTSWWITQTWIDIMKSYKSYLILRLPPSAVHLPSLLWKRTVPQLKKKNMRSIPHSPRFIKTLIEHPLLGLFFTEELSVDHHCNYSGNLNQAYSYVLTTRHLLNDTVDLSSPCCLLSWAEPFIMNVGIILRLYPTPLRHHRRISSSWPYSCHHSHRYSDALVDDTAKLDSPIRLNSIDQIVTSDESFIYPPLREWEKNPVWKHPEWLLRSSSGWEGKGRIFRRCGLNFWARSRTLYHHGTFICPSTSS